MNYGEFGGQYVPQELKEKLNEIEKEFLKSKDDESFKKEYMYYLKQYVGRPTPLYYAENLTKYVGGAKIYLKREDLNHTGAHKINNVLGQALLAKIEEQGYEQTIEEVAYTWFSRFIALRFMEVNGYIPTRVRVFTDAENNFKPEIMSEAINMDLDGINVDHIYGLKDANMDEELFGSIVKSITVESNAEITFNLIGGIRLTEEINMRGRCKTA